MLSLIFPLECLFACYVVFVCFLFLFFFCLFFVVVILFLFWFVLFWFGSVCVYFRFVLFLFYFGLFFHPYVLGCVECSHRLAVILLRAYR